MKPDIVSRLLELNRQFYTEHGASFAATRRRVQPGQRLAVEKLPHDARWLDLGCGNGELGVELLENGLCCSYLGLDFSPDLLRAARPSGAELRQADLSAPNWAEELPAGGFEVVAAFAVLHHLPGCEMREQVLREARRLIAPGGVFIHSVWQFQHNPRLMARVQPWEKAGIDPRELESGDTLLDWRHILPGQPETPGLRYVHLFTLEELSDLADRSGFTVRETYESDGESGRQGLYQIWE